MYILYVYVYIYIYIQLDVVNFANIIIIIPISWDSDKHLFVQMWQIHGMFLKIVMPVPLERRYESSGDRKTKPLGASNYWILMDIDGSNGCK